MTSTKQRVFILAILTMMVCGLNPAWAKNGFSQINGFRLKTACTTALDVIDKKTVTDVTQATNDFNMCTNYLTAFNDALYFVANASSGGLSNPNANVKMPYCMPDNADQADNVRILLRFMSENPASAAVPAPMVIYDAYMKYYPCK